MSDGPFTHMAVTLGRVITVSPEGFQMLCALAEHHKVCQQCSRPYTSERPNVALNRCLPCFLRADPQRQRRNLQFLGPKAGEEGTFLHIDNQNFLCLSKVTSSECVRSHLETLNYWKYGFPTEATSDDQAIPDIPGSWNIYGRPGSGALVIAWQDGPRIPKEYIWLTHCNGHCQLLDKRRKAITNLFRQARTRAEQTRDADGYYHLTFEYGYYRRNRLSEEDLYPVIAQIKSEERAVEPPRA